MMLRYIVYNFLLLSSCLKHFWVVHYDSHAIFQQIEFIRNLLIKALGSCNTIWTFLYVCLLFIPWHGNILWKQCLTINHSAKWRWIVVDKYPAGKYPPLSPTLRWIICFSIYHTSWITSGPKTNFICKNIPIKAILFFFGCSEVNSTWLITSELASQHVQKVLFTCVVYTKLQYFNASTIEFSKSLHWSPTSVLKGHCHAIWQLYKKLEGAFTSIEFLM